MQWYRSGWLEDVPQDHRYNRREDTKVLFGRIAEMRGRSSVKSGSLSSFLPLTQAQKGNSNESLPEQPCLKRCTASKGFGMFNVGMSGRCCHDLNGFILRIRMRKIKRYVIWKQTAYHNDANRIQEEKMFFHKNSFLHLKTKFIVTNFFGKC